jgi:hypothetical protein
VAYAAVLPLLRTIPAVFNPLLKRPADSSSARFGIDINCDRYSLLITPVDLYAMA